MEAENQREILNEVKKHLIERIKTLQKSLTEQQKQDQYSRNFDGYSFDESLKLTGKIEELIIQKIYIERLRKSLLK